jgi:alkylhydroperoxidase family enzyme
MDNTKGEKFMRYLPVSKIPLVEEETASGEVAEVFGKIRRNMGTPSVSITDMVAANSPAILDIWVDLFQSFMERTILPQPLVYMIHYTISTTKQCACCSVNFKHACQSVGIDEVLLDALIHDLDAVSPKRTGDIIHFAVNCALNPLSLVEADYDNLRNQGVTDQELVEISFLASMAVLNDTWAESLRLGDPTNQELIEA